MDGRQDLADVARGIIDANLYMTLGTADATGMPWVSPVYYAAKDYTEFFWISSPEATHSKNLAFRPQVRIVIFDSQVPAYSGQAVYMTATAAELTGAEIDRAVECYPGPAERGARALTADELRAPAVYRIYRATVTRHEVLCNMGAGRRCPVHGRAGDHRATVQLPGTAPGASPA